MIYASAQGVRKMSSKLRFVLQDFSYIKVDLVRGKDFWRVTSASKTDMLEDLSKNSQKLRVLHNISRLLKRLLAGEDANAPLFADLLKGFFVLEKSNTKEELENVEVIIVLRALSKLGYIGGGGAVQAFVQSPLEDELVFEVAKSRMKILREINKALKETHL